MSALQKTSFICVFLLLWPISFLTLLSQSYYFDNYGVTDGLDQSRVYCILQDDQDFIWLGTESGVSRFNGVVFENYTEINGIAKYGVRSIYMDNNNHIWLGHNGGGITVFKNGNFNIPDLKGVEVNSDITDIIQDKHGNIWFSTLAQGVFMISKDSMSISPLPVHHYKGKDISDRVFQIEMIKNKDILLFITDVGVKKYNYEKNEFQTFILEGLPVYFQFTDIYEDSQGNIWFGTYHGGLYLYNTKKDSFTFYESKNGLANNWVTCIKEDSNGIIWVGTWGGGISRIGEKGIMTFNTDNGLQDNKIGYITEDIEGNILIGTFEHGLSIFKGEHFVTFTEKDGLINNQIWAIYQDHKDKFWFGSNEGISVFNPGKEQQEFIHYTKKKDIIDNHIRFIRQDRDNNIWIGTNGGGVYKYLYQKDEFEYILLLNNRLLYRDLIVTAMECDHNNNLWVGTNDGLVYYEIETGKGDRLTQRNGLAGNKILCLYRDSNDVLWIGTDDNYVTCFYPGENDFKKIKKLGKVTPSAMIEDKEGNIWIGTESDGVLVFDHDTITAHYTVEDGLLANLINLLNVDEKNNIYIGTNKGLNVYNRMDEAFLTYTEKSGFVGIETKPNSTLRDKNGDLWFGTGSGVTRFQADKTRKEKIDPLTHIHRVLVYDEPVEMLPGKKYNYSENQISFEYYSVCLTDPDAVEYKVMLEGADKSWLDVKKQTRIKYSALSPGEYTFKVIARNNFGVWNKEPVTYSFFIKPPFYATWWFILICIVLGTTSILVYIKLRERKLIKEKHILEETVKERTREVVQKNEELAMKNKDITDSITYAQRIQFAMLPPELPFSKTFILFKPKDIVSGDFYWLQTTDELEFLAAVDCTGHGVPGAFMSIIGFNSLNKIVKEYKIYEPAKILDQLNIEVSRTLHHKRKQSLEEVKDGMDISLISYHTRTRELQYAGAYNSLYYFKNGEFFETKADRIAIGHGEENRHQYTNHCFNMEEGDTIYLFSDGYADQFGGPDHKKFKSSHVKKYLRSIQDKDMDEQHSLLEKKHLEWKGTLEQIDDIIFIGRRFD